MRNSLTPAAICCLLGLTLALQVKTQGKVPRADDSTRVSEEIVSQFIRISQERDRIREETERMRQSVAQLAPQAQLQAELLLGLAAAGLVEVRGPGVSVVLADNPSDTISTRRVETTDILLLLNDLRAGGSEAIAINGIRATPQLALARTPGSDGSLTIGGHLVTGPVIIEAIGDPGVLSASLNMRGGVIEQLSPWLSAEVSIRTDLLITPTATPVFQYARTVP